MSQKTSATLLSDDPILQFFRSKLNHHDRSYFVIHYATLCKEAIMDVIIIITMVYCCVGVNTSSVYAYNDYDYDDTCSYPSFR